MPTVEARLRQELRDYAVELRQLAYTLPNGVGEHDLFDCRSGCRLLLSGWSARGPSHPPSLE